MRKIKLVATLLMVAVILSSCGATKTITDTAISNTETTVETVVETSTTSTNEVLVAKKGEMSETEIQTWPHADIVKDSIPGISLEKAYEFVKNKQGKTVVVGVIDSGIDIEHEDLKNVVWVNNDEIPNNGKDDDNNGYADDIHGWNFLGGEQGKSNPEQLELTRIVKKWMPRFENTTAASVADKDKADFEQFTNLKKIVEQKITNASNQVTTASKEVNQYTIISQMVSQANDSILKLLGTKEYTIENVNALNFDDQNLKNAKVVILRILDSGSSVAAAKVELAEIVKHYKEVVDHYKSQVNHQYKIDYNGRLAGDNPYDINDTKYGNAFVIGSKDDEIHGTHVSGIIAAERNNGVGMNGVAHNVKIMAIRAVPDGDEYDKDVALAIRYAVDNGAKVVNMSFGKGHSPNAEWVYDAIKYAAQKDVVLVHAAGNDGSDIDTSENYPTDAKDKINELANNVITVGAMTRFYNDKLVASFSNYGKKNVDVFAPGLEIYSTFPKDSYESIQGTSMAAPEVAGVAALIRSYYPSLSASQVKSIIMNSGIEFHQNVIKPGSTTEKVNFDNLSVSGKILNAYNALVMADKLAKEN